MAGERDVSLRNMNFAKVERGGRLIGRDVFTDKYGNLKTGSDLDHCLDHLDPRLAEVCAVRVRSSCLNCVQSCFKHTYLT